MPTTPPDNRTAPRGPGWSSCGTCPTITDCARRAACLYRARRDRIEAPPRFDLGHVVIHWRTGVAGRVRGWNWARPYGGAGGWSMVVEIREGERVGWMERDCLLPSEWLAVAIPEAILDEGGVLGTPPEVDPQTRTAPHGDALATTTRESYPNFFSTFPNTVEPDGDGGFFDGITLPPTTWRVQYIPARDFSGDPQRHTDWVAAENGMGC